MTTSDGISRTLLVALAVTAYTATGVRGADEKAWFTQPYRIHIHLAVDSSDNPGFVSPLLASEVERQIHRVLYPLWKAEITLHNGVQRSTLLRRLGELESLADQFDEGADKTLFLTVTASVGGIELTCRENDRLTGQWTPVLTRTVRQRLLLPQHCLEILCETFAPRALVRVDPTNDGLVELAFQGSELLDAGNRRILVNAQDVFQPFFVRRNRAGNAVGKSIPVPWTYLVAQQPTADAWSSSVYSGTRRPFGARRRAGIDIIALGLKPVELSTKVRFHAGHNKSLGLAGYEVFAKAATAKEYQPIGRTDRFGSVLVSRQGFPITLVTLRSENQLLAQVPIAVGTVPTEEIPVADDTARLLVQETLTTFREQLVDIIARRNILMARARDQMQKGEAKSARDLVDQIGDLPSRANLDRFLATLERDPANRSENPRVQAKIDRLFADSRKMMSNYLTTREVLELENELNRGESAE